MTTPTSTEQTADLLHAVLADLAIVVGGITPEQLHAPRPCTAFDVEQLRDHVLGWLTHFAAGFADPDGHAPNADIDGYQAPADAAGQVRAAAEKLDRAIRGGAATRPLRLGDSAMPGDLALGMILWEYQVHGWDLARATGQHWSPPIAAAQESLNFAPAMLSDDYQGDGKPFGKPVDVPAGATLLDRLLGLSGRNPPDSGRRSRGLAWAVPAAGRRGSGRGRFTAMVRLRPRGRRRGTSCSAGRSRATARRARATAPTGPSYRAG
ncbi:MAG: TIGR03086 family metal-binding protein [Pseudonocardiaceae bacterium]